MVIKYRPLKAEFIPGFRFVHIAVACSHINFNRAIHLLVFAYTGKRKRYIIHDVKKIFVSQAAFAELAFESGASGFIRMPYSYYTGQNHAVFYTSSLDLNDPTKSEYTLNRFSLSDLKPESGIVTVRAAEPHILGVLSDGRTVFWYSLNPAETGICITK